MNQTIWKFETPFEEKFEIEMPKGAEILSIQRDEKTSIPCIWALVYPENEKEKRMFELFGTGHSIHNDMCVSRKYVGSYQYQKGEFVGHVFERLF